MEKIKITKKSSQGVFFNAEKNILKSATRGSFGYKYVIGVDGVQVVEKYQFSKDYRRKSHSIQQMQAAGYILTTITELLMTNGPEHIYYTDSLYINNRYTSKL